MRLERTDDQVVVEVYGVALKAISQSTYPGSVISISGKLDAEIQHRTRYQGHLIQHVQT